jgi:AcrR family transcriptional regulator
MQSDPSTIATEERPLRKDAARNRERILEAARAVFAERGLEVTLDDIAHHAGVGVGTVYRRFSDKEQLIDALFDERLDAIATRAEQALAIDDPWLALEGWFVGMLEEQAGDRGLREIAFAGRHGRERVARGRARIEPLIDQLVARAHASGQLRADVVAVDMQIIQKMICDVMDVTRAVSPDIWRRYLAIVLDGLRPARDAPTQLPVPALDRGNVEVCMRTRLSRRA